MDASTPSTCPRCSGNFICRSDAISECHCTALQLTPQTADEIAQQWRDCLCEKCLKQVALQQNGLMH
ncbi:cysteine-rich CWC family protein [Teredinibacter purpureus]|uniref:cysteine-rich CWC family protein n=1 Tax=Teredinibacter purpureus TaxID=2731756 RepID=UPI0009E5C57C